MSEADEQRARVRYRLTGGVFLVALLVIGLPILFDGPAAPAPEIEPLATVTQDLDTPALPDESAARGEQPDTESPASADADAEAAAALVQQVEVLDRSVDTDGFRTSDGSRFGQPRLVVEDDTTSVWAVQVGSFGDADKAKALRDRLRAERLEAFIAQYKHEGKVFARVAVGPLLSRDHAETLQRDLSARYDSEPRIMAFSE